MEQTEDPLDYRRKFFLDLCIELILGTQSNIYIYVCMYMYSQTPVRLDVAIWPGGDINLPPGTVHWAGGFIDWGKIL